jgi:hypothetical protein
MLDASYKTKENAIEEIIYDYLDNRKISEMTKEQTELYLQIAMIPKNIALKKEEKPFLFQLMEKRIEHCFTFKVTDERILLALCTWIDSAGNSILYLWYIQGWCFKNNIKELDFDTFSMKIFPFGIFSKENLSTVWDSQKVEHTYLDSDNLVDYALAGSSIQFATINE